ncbi:DUF2341 domain-containing protein [bacterium]|nr:DUF2341 domain-containing protein [bacterium]
MSSSKFRNNRGFSLVEVIVALGIFTILAMGVFNVVTNSYSNFSGSGNREVIAEFAQEGIEAAKAIRNNSWQDIEDAVGSNHGVSKNASGVWNFVGISDTWDTLTRVVTVADVQRDANGDIVASGGTDDSNTKKITVTISASGITDYVLNTYVTDWSRLTWEQSDWSGGDDREFWSNNSMASSSFSNINTSTAGLVTLSQVAGTEFSWADWADLEPDSTATYKYWEDFYDFEFSPDGKSLYIAGTTNFDFVKYDITKAAAGIFSPMFKIQTPGFHTTALAVHPNENYAYLGKRGYTNGVDAVCIANLSTRASMVASTDCQDVTMAGTTIYPMEMIINEAADRLYIFDTYGYGYTFSISADGSTLTLLNPGQNLGSSAINYAYLDESGDDPYIYIVADSNTAEFRKMGIDETSGWFSSTSTYAYYDGTYGDITDIEFLETSSGNNRFLIVQEYSSKEFVIIEDTGTSLTEIGYYDITTSSYRPQLSYDGENMALVRYYNGELHDIDITDRENPADGGLADYGYNRPSSWVTYDQLVFSTTSQGFFMNEHYPAPGDESDNIVRLRFIGRPMNRATGGTYDYRRKITLGLNSTVLGGPHTDFPIVISEGQDYLKTVTNGGKVKNDNGYDIVFASDVNGESILDHEIEYYSSSTGEFTAWVRMDSMASDTDIYMFYGNANISSTQENITQVWRNDYRIVKHMTASGPDGATASATSSDGMFSKSGQAGPTEVAGKIGRSLSFDGDYDYLYVEKNIDKMAGYDDFTVEAWLKPSSLGHEYSSIVYFGNGDQSKQDGWLLRHRAHSDDTLYFHMGWNNQISYGGESSPVIINDVWTYSAVTVDRDLKHQMYTNTVAGNSFTTTSDAYFLDNVYDWYIGRDWSSSSLWFEGEIDEVRISSTLRSTDWMTTGYNNINATSSFYSIDSEASVGYNSPGSFYSSILDLGSTDKELRSISVEQNIPTDCALEITLEADNDSSFASLTSQVFSDTSSSYYTSTTPATLSGKRWLRYKADLTACNNSTEAPSLYSVKLNYR